MITLGTESCNGHILTEFIPIIYLALISLISVITTIYDKWASKHRADRRIRESSLLALSLVGGSVAMLATMLAIRHKTKHAKFMVGIPLIILCQAVLAYLIFKYVAPGVRIVL